MRSLPLVLIGMLLCAGIVVLIPDETSAEPDWIGSHLYVDQWLYFEIGALDQGTEVKYGVEVTTPDESVNLAIMDSTNYAAFESDVETFVGFHVQRQVRSMESSAVIPYQQVWYFIVVSDTWSEIDIKYYVEVVEEDDGGGICGGAMVAGALMIIAMLGIVSIIRRR